MLPVDRKYTHVRSTYLVAELATAGAAVVLLEALTMAFADGHEGDPSGRTYKFEVGHLAAASDHLRLAHG